MPQHRRRHDHQLCEFRRVDLAARYAEPFAIPRLDCGFLVIPVVENIRLCFRHKFVGRVYNGINKSGGLCRIRRQAFSLEQVGQGSLDAEQVDRSHNAAGPWKQTQGHLRKPDLHRLFVHRNSVVTGEANLVTTAQCGAINGRDNGHW